MTCYCLVCMVGSAHSLNVDILLKFNEDLEQFMRYGEDMNVSQTDKGQKDRQTKGIPIIPFRFAAGDLSMIYLMSPPADTCHDIATCWIPLNISGHEMFCLSHHCHVGCIHKLKNTIKTENKYIHVYHILRSTLLRISKNVRSCTISYCIVCNYVNYIE